MKCVLCKKRIEGHGHNPYPLSKRGACCDECNMKVMEARIRSIQQKEGEMA